MSESAVKPLVVQGFRVGVAACGIKQADAHRDDLALIVADVPVAAAAVLTQNRFRAPCVDLCAETLAVHADAIRALVVNSGNANAGLGSQGRGWAESFVAITADALGLRPTELLSASTGVIGEPFPIQRIEAALPKAIAALCDDAWLQAAEAIRTTDTFAKYATRQGDGFSLLGIAKGSGMIHPNMATMLGFVVTDAAIEADVLQAILRRVADRSFNCISVDGDTSTNDSLVVLASGVGLGREPLQDTTAFEATLLSLCIELAQAIVKDGEGVSKFVTIEVTSAETEQQARQLGRAVAVSPLVKTAFAGSDANWGRLIAAMGNSGVAFQSERVSVRADDVLMLQAGELHADYRDADGMAVFAKDAFTIAIDLGMGTAEATVWTGDLTHEYIAINAEYRS